MRSSIINEILYSRSLKIARDKTASPVSRALSVFRVDDTRASSEIREGLVFHGIGMATLAKELSLLNFSSVGLWTREL